MTLRDRFNSAKRAGLVSSAALSTASRFYNRNLREPGDCAGDDALLAGLAIAEAEIGKGIGWIPRVQHLGELIANLKNDSPSGPQPSLRERSTSRAA
jgi:hypothetical protein